MIKKSAIALLIIYFIWSLVTIALRLSSLPTGIDAIMTIDTNSPKINLIDEDGDNVGSISFDDEITVTIKRHKK